MKPTKGDHPTKSCTLQDCDRPLRARGLCAMHWRQEHGRPTRYAIICEHCGAAHDSSRPDGKYCSEKCKTAARQPRETTTRSALPPDHPVMLEISRARAAESSRRARDQRSPVRAAYEDDEPLALILAIKARCVETSRGCWIWQGRLKDGYPVMHWQSQGSTVYLSMHRVALEAKLERKLGGQPAHHVCGQSACCNPDHLQPVTQRDNVAEMLARNYMVERITELEDALRRLRPEHPLLKHVSIVPALMRAV